MPEKTGDVYDWTLQDNNGRFYLYRFVENDGLLQVNGQQDYLPKHEASIMGVFVKNPDIPLISDDFSEAGIDVRGNKLQKGIEGLQTHELIGKHVLQLGRNKRAIYAFLTVPYNKDVLEHRMLVMSNEMKGTLEGDRYKEKAVLLSKVVAGIVGTASVYFY